jgi:pyrroloquinoline-quinone synthase
MSSRPPTTIDAQLPPDSPSRFERRLREIGDAAYHDKHPFHILMHQGRLNQRQLRAWIENRFYYQCIIPRKDATILAKTDDPVFRRMWITRIADHDGANEREGGIRKWLRLAEAAGLDPGEVAQMRFVLPAVRFAVDAYLHLVDKCSLAAAVASSLTELFAPMLMADRVAVLESLYPWLAPQGLEYFKSRLIEAPRDAEFGLQYVLDNCVTRTSQDEAAAALEEKCRILWCILDAIYFAYVSPGFAPPLWSSPLHE